MIISTIIVAILLMTAIDSRQSWMPNCSSSSRV
jgi:hypothetical protein